MGILSSKKKNERPKFEKIFMSYSMKDDQFAQKMAKDLKSSGLNVWIDKLDLAVGSRWDLEIEKAIDESDTILVLISKNSVLSTNVQDEVSIFISENKTVIPVMLEECELPMRWKRIQYINFIDRPYDEAFMNLLSVFGIEEQNVQDPGKPGAGIDPGGVIGPKGPGGSSGPGEVIETKADEPLIQIEDKPDEDDTKRDLNVFISYSHQDKDTARAIREALQELDINVTIDEEDMYEGQEIKQFITDSIKKANVVLSLISNRSLRSGWVGIETFNTMFSESQNGQRKLIGCVLDSDFFQYDYTLKTIEALKEEIDKRKDVLIRQLEHDVSVTDISSEIDRLRNLKKNFPETMKRLRDFKCIDVSDQDHIKKEITKFAEQLKSRPIFT